MISTFKPSHHHHLVCNLVSAVISSTSPNGVKSCASMTRLLRLTCVTPGWYLSRQRLTHVSHTLTHVSHTLTHVELG